MRKRTAARAPKPPRIAYCKHCGVEIPSEKLVKSPHLQFLDREHLTAWLISQGHYQRIGKMGVEAQAAVKAETGHVPQYEKRALAVAASNKEKPRRRRKDVLQ